MSRITCPRSLLLVLAVLARSALALEFDMMFQTKCVMEEINEGVLVVGDYSGVSKSDYTTPVALDVKVGIPMQNKILGSYSTVREALLRARLQVEDPRGRQIFEKKKETSGQFAFTSKASGDYKACFTAKDVQTALNTKLRLDWRTGVAATDWDAIAKKDHLDELRMELLKLEEMAKDIHTEMLHLRKREEEMRDLNEETNERVAWFSIASLFICVGLALWQLWYLRRFFHRKKLL